MSNTSNKSKKNPETHRKPQQKPKRTKAKTLIVPSSEMKMSYNIPECAMHYAAALADPFNAPEGACIPSDLFPLPSGKTRGFSTGTFQLGTTGYGWISLNPSITNDATCVTYTTSTSVGTGATLLSAYTNTATSTFYNLSATNAQVTAGQVQGRIVSYGVRVKYVGSLMARNGVAVAYEDPDHFSVAPQNYNGLHLSQYAARDRIGGDQWDTDVLYSGPVQPSDIEFLGAAFPLNSAAAIAVIAIKGAAGDIYEFEACAHIETIGVLVPGRTPSHSAPVAMGSVLETAKTIATHKPLQSKDSPGFFSTLISTIRNGLPSLMAGGKAIHSLITGDLPGAMQHGAKFVSGPHGQVALRSLAGGAYNGSSLNHVPEGAPDTRPWFEKMLGIH